VYSVAQNTCQNGNYRHGQQSKHSESHIDVKHETNGRQAKNYRVSEGHHPHANSHPDVKDVIGGVGHQISRSSFVEIGCREGLDMEEEPISYPLFHSPGCSYETSAPEKAEYSDQQGHGNHIESIAKKRGCRSSAGGQVIYSPLDDARDEELKHVNDKQGKEAKGNCEPLFHKVRFDKAV
jgi:hypothetical protein